MLFGALRIMSVAVLYSAPAFDVTKIGSRYVCMFYGSVAWRPLCEKDIEDGLDDVFRMNERFREA